MMFRHFIIQLDLRIRSFHFNPSGLNEHFIHLLLHHVSLEFKLVHFVVLGLLNCFEAILVQRHPCQGIRVVQ